MTGAEKDEKWCKDSLHASFILSSIVYAKKTPTGVANVLVKLLDELDDERASVGCKIRRNQ